MEVLHSQNKLHAGDSFQRHLICSSSDVVIVGIGLDVPLAVNLTLHLNRRLDGAAITHPATALWWL